MIAQPDNEPLTGRQMITKHYVLATTALVFADIFTTVITTILERHRLWPRTELLLNELEIKQSEGSVRFNSET